MLMVTTWMLRRSAKRRKFILSAVKKATLESMAAMTLKSSRVPGLCIPLSSTAQEWQSQCMTPHVSPLCSPYPQGSRMTFCYLAGANPSCPALALPRAIVASQVCPDLACQHQAFCLFHPGDPFVPYDPLHTFLSAPGDSDPYLP